MHRIAKFHKVSAEQFMEAMGKTLPDYAEEDRNASYEAVRLPVRATSGSAGYDFCLPFDITLQPGEEILIPTGIRAQMEKDWVLTLYPRSGLGFKYRLQLNNTVGVIDSDYFYSDNEGHIMCRMINDSRSGRIVDLKRGEAFMQGIFLQYGITMDDEAAGIRNGGFGSTKI